MKDNIGENFRVLIVDDNRAIHEDFQKVLGSKQGASAQLLAGEEALFGLDAAQALPGIHFQIDSAYQGQEALAMVQRAMENGKPYAVAFMDVRMPPGWDGIETTNELWKVDPDLQIIVCTAYSDYSWHDMLGKLGQSDRFVILKKPFDSVEVLQLANSLTKKRQFLQQARAKLASLEQLVEARTAQLAHEQENFRVIFDNSPDGILRARFDGRLLNANPALARILGYPSPAALLAEVTHIGQQLFADPRQPVEFKEQLAREKVVRHFESEMKCRDGTRKWTSMTASTVIDPEGRPFVLGFVEDITAQKKAGLAHDLLEAQLRQAQKLESVGQLAAGIAHEINTPIQYIGDNIHFVEDAFRDVCRMISDQQKLMAAVQMNAVTPELLAAAETSSEQADFSYLSTEVPKAIRQSLDGVSHVTNIVCAMKEFSHPGKVEKVSTDINHAIETTLTVSRNAWRYVAEVEKDFAPDLPHVSCLPSEFNQVILNLVVNAAHAIGDLLKGQEDVKGTITISTRLEGAWVVIRIADTGGGIPEAIRHRIFEPFFTTKPVGKGTGQGLAIARSTIMQKHGGQLDFEAVTGQGTTFIIRLPVDAEATEGKES